MDLTCNIHRQAGLVCTLVNLAIPGKRQGSAYEPPTPTELVRTFAGHLSPHHADALTAGPFAAPDLATLARELHAVLVSPEIRTTASLLNRMMAKYRAQPYLTDDTDQPFHLHFHGTGAGSGKGGEVAVLGGEFATALALVIDMIGKNRFGSCCAHACDRVYVDLTRNGSRQYCGEACAARAKTAAYRARRG